METKKVRVSDVGRYLDLSGSSIAGWDISVARADEVDDDDVDIDADLT
jgi:hypothetical protein